MDYKSRVEQSKFVIGAVYGASATERPLITIYEK